MKDFQLKLYSDHIKLPEAFVRFKQGASLDSDLLSNIVFHHTLTFPLETIDLHDQAKEANQKGISIEIDDLIEKMITNKRGGYCIETTELLYHALTYLGFDTRRLLATVLLHQETRPVAVHEILMVKLANQHFLVDPGFGSYGSVYPLLFAEEEQICLKEQQFPTQPGIQFQFAADEEVEGGFKLLLDSGSHLIALYAFNPQNFCDMQLLKERGDNVCMTKSSPFWQRLFIIKPFLSSDGTIKHHTLTSNIYRCGTIDNNDNTAINSKAEFIYKLNTIFGITLNSNTDFSAKGVIFEEPEPVCQFQSLSALLESGSSVDAMIKQEQTRELLLSQPLSPPRQRVRDLVQITAINPEATPKENDYSIKYG